MDGQNVREIRLPVNRRRAAVGKVLWHVLPIAAVILGLFFYWFAIANRYVIFLYGHIAGGCLTTAAQPFDRVTSTRYWMAGLVAAAFVLLGNTALNVCCGFFAASQGRAYAPPRWLRVWGLCALIVVPGLLSITMLFNAPTLPFPLALICVLVTLGGLALALLPGALAARNPNALLWLALDGLGLVPSLLFLHAYYIAAEPLRGRFGMLYLIGLGLAAMWWGILSGLRAWRRRLKTRALDVFIAGLCWSYLLLPLVHYLLAAPAGHAYISSAGNFFAFNGCAALSQPRYLAPLEFSGFNLGVQLAAWGIALLLARGLAWLRKSLARLATPHSAADSSAML